MSDRQPGKFVSAGGRAAGERIKIEHQYLIGYAWLGLIVLPPIVVAFAIMIQPWIVAADLSVGRPAAEMDAADVARRDGPQRHRDRDPLDRPAWGLVRQQRRGGARPCAPG